METVILSFGLALLSIAGLRSCVNSWSRASDASLNVDVDFKK
jgi:hypothetical protein